METDDNNNTFSLLRLLAEADLIRKYEGIKYKGKISKQDTITITDAIYNSLTEYDQSIIIDNNPYKINDVVVEKNTVLLWLWSESIEEEKTIRITISASEMDVDPSYLDDEEND